MIPRNHIDLRTHGSSQRELWLADPNQNVPQDQANNSKTAGQRCAIALQVTASMPQDEQSTVGAGALALLWVDWKLQQSDDDNTIPDALGAKCCRQAGSSAFHGNRRLAVKEGIHAALRTHAKAQARTPGMA
jgi:hypothetical protein